MDKILAWIERHVVDPQGKPMKLTEHQRAWLAHLYRQSSS